MKFINFSKTFKRSQDSKTKLTPEFQVSKCIHYTTGFINRPTGTTCPTQSGTLRARATDVT